MIDYEILIIAFTFVLTIVTVTKKTAPDLSPECGYYRKILRHQPYTGKALLIYMIHTIFSNVDIPLFTVVA